MTDFSIEKSIEGPVIGLDEVGRGPLAGPVISCGCLFYTYKSLQSDIQINDSKKHTLKQREKLFKFFKKLQKEKIIQYHLGFATVTEIDELNILEATKLSMKRAIDKFKNYNLNIIIDGNFNLKYRNIKERSVVGGDKLSLSIAAASIIAKVHRDRLMRIYHNKFNIYGWKRNSGYGTKQHIEAINKNGITNLHRRSFEPIKSLINN
ncbi:MAG: ribonuclease HII [Pelagibacteraceae bacterium TMED237]|nr:MAG: ribonuclease HII [Pelagibacteraceae bacterium TMED237]|tara:strand:+ start:8060 stop:8680 length:621 start_codon:yes stop_codon:yes gene_type:complete